VFSVASIGAYFCVVLFAVPCQRLYRMYWLLDEFFNRGKFLAGREWDFAELQLLMSYLKLDISEEMLRFLATILTKNAITQDPQFLRVCEIFSGVKSTKLNFY
jgi:hypothetical protein